METNGKSWADDLNAYATKKRAPPPPPPVVERYGRTPHAPFGDLHHPGYHLPYTAVVPGPADVDRYTRHGWCTQQQVYGKVYGQGLTTRSHFRST